MRIPRSRLKQFAAGLIQDCLVSRTDRIHRGLAYRNVFLTGDENADAQIYNKTYAYIDDLESLLYSPVSLRFNLTGTHGPADQAKMHAAASDMHRRIRESNSDTSISGGVLWSLVKGKAFTKLMWERGQLAPYFVQPENMGVLQENLTKLDENMEAFVHSTYITPYQLARRLYNNPSRVELMRKARKYMRPPKGDDPRDDNALKQIVIGGLYPFQAQGSATPNNTRGIVDWMGGPNPRLAPHVLQELMRLDELWVWNDEDEDWATFQMIGDDLMILGEDYICNALAFNTSSREHNKYLKGHHPFIEWCPNRMENYFWGRSEIENIALLQIAINARINGINGLLRMQEDPPKVFSGAAGVNQLALSKLARPGGYFSDANPNAKVQNLPPEINQDLFISLHEYERMFDEMGGLPPIAKGRGEAGVRSQAHAETLVRMFSPRFKDRALLVERDVEEFGGLALDICRAHVPDKLTAWVPPEAAGMEAAQGVVPIRQAPVPNTVEIDFIYAQLPDDTKVTVDSHSSSPAFAMEARQLVFDLFKIGAMSPEDVVQHVDAPDPDALMVGIQRREAAKAAFLQQHPELLHKGGKK